MRSPRKQFAKRSALGFSLFIMPLPAEPSQKMWKISNKLHKQINGLQRMRRSNNWILMVKPSCEALLGFPSLDFFWLLALLLVEVIEYGFVYGALFALFRSIQGILINQDVWFFKSQSPVCSEPSMLFFNHTSAIHMIDLYGYLVYVFFLLLILTIRQIKSDQNFFWFNQLHYCRGFHFQHGWSEQTTEVISNPKYNPQSSALCHWPTQDDANNVIIWSGVIFTCGSGVYSQGCHS